MPVKVVKRNGKFRVVEKDTGKICKNKGGTACDGGGHSSMQGALRQATAININS